MINYLHDSKEMRRYRWHPACPDVLQRQVKITDIHGQIAHSRLPSKLLHEGTCLLEHADKLAHNTVVFAGQSFPRHVRQVALKSKRLMPTQCDLLFVPDG